MKASRYWVGIWENPKETDDPCNLVEKSPRIHFLTGQIEDRKDGSKSYQVLIYLQKQRELSFMENLQPNIIWKPVVPTERDQCYQDLHRGRVPAFECGRRKPQSFGTAISEINPLKGPKSTKTAEILMRNDAKSFRDKLKPGKSISDEKGSELAISSFPNDVNSTPDYNFNLDRHKYVDSSQKNILHQDLEKQTREIQTYEDSDFREIEGMSSTTKKQKSGGYLSPAPKSLISQQKMTESIEGAEKISKETCEIENPHLLDNEPSASTFTKLLGTPSEIRHPEIVN